MPYLLLTLFFLYYYCGFGKSFCFAIHQCSYFAVYASLHLPFFLISSNSAFITQYSFFYIPLSLIISVLLLSYKLSRCQFSMSFGFSWGFSGLCTFFCVLLCTSEVFFSLSFFQYITLLLSDSLYRSSVDRMIY